MKLILFAEVEDPAKTKESTPDSEETTSKGSAEVAAALLYQGFIDQVRDKGATKKSLNKLMIEWARYSKEYPIPNVPIAVCLGMFEETTAKELEKNSSLELVKEKGRIAYCSALPKLGDRESIRDFIACVVHGMALGIIPGPEGTRLLYGAQVAQAALPPKRKWRKDPAKSKPKDAPK